MNIINFIPHTFALVSNTVADIVGFTAWSSVREPSQVFVLLETLYSAFDKIAEQRRIYKVETIGTHMSMLMAMKNQTLLTFFVFVCR